MDANTRYTGKQLGQILDAQGRKRRWLCSRVNGLHEWNLSRYISGTSTVDRAMAERIAEVMQVPFGMLFELHGAERSDASTDEEGQAA